MAVQVVCDSGCCQGCCQNGANCVERQAGQVRGHRCSDHLAHHAERSCPGRECSRQTSCQIDLGQWSSCCVVGRASREWFDDFSLSNRYSRIQLRHLAILELHHNFGGIPNDHPVRHEWQSTSSQGSCKELERIWIMVDCPKHGDWATQGTNK